MVNINLKKPKLWALVRTKSGRIEKREVLFRNSTSKLYNQYVKDFETGLYLKRNTNI